MESPQEGGRGSAQGCWRAWACCCCPGRPGEPGGSPRCTWSHTGCWWSTPCLSWRCPPSTSPDRVPARWQPGAWRIRCSGWYGVPEQWPDGLPSQLSSLPLRTRWSSVSTTWVMPLLCFFLFCFYQNWETMWKKSKKKDCKESGSGVFFLVFSLFVSKWDFQLIDDDGFQKTNQPATHNKPLSPSFIILFFLSLRLHTLIAVLLLILYCQPRPNSWVISHMIPFSGP